MSDQTLEAYCVSCKRKVEMEDPTPVWTRRGTPGTRGTCPNCGTNVFRMGRTEAHEDLPKPEVTSRPDVARSRSISTQMMALITYAPEDGDFAHKLAQDLDKMGIPAWVDFVADVDDVNWASGVHPAFEECSHMVVILSENTSQDEGVEQMWETFRQRRKPIIVAQVEDAEVPDELRTRPRYDFTDEYKPAFRKLLQSLMT